MRTLAQLTAVGLLSLGLVGCEEGSARSAVEGAEAAITAIQDRAANIAPVRLQSLQDSLAAIKTRLEAGEHRSALMSARSVTALARDLGATLDNTKTQLESAFQTASNELPGMLERVNSRLSEVAAMRRPPAGMDPNQVAALRAESSSWPELWNQANQEFQAGKLASAMGKANDLRAKLRTAAGVLGMEG